MTTERRGDENRAGGETAATTEARRTESRQMARRYFLRAVVYGAPTVAGVVALRASAQGVSCDACQTQPLYCAANEAQCVPACVAECP